MHSQINKLFKILFISAFALISLNSYAESSKEFGDYVIHYNAFRSDTISPEVAKQHGLARANNRVLINIAILKKVMNTTGKPTLSWGLSLIRCAGSPIGHATSVPVVSVVLSSIRGDRELQVLRLAVIRAQRMRVS